MRILLVEDDIDLARWLTKALRDERFTVECVNDGAAAEALLKTEDYALMILDLTLPKLDGLQVLKGLRSRGSRTPVLVVTARGEIAERVEGLNLGADDYLLKPFALAEMEARVKALLRRSQGEAAPRIACGTLVFDTVSREFTCDRTRLTLTPREHAVLEALIMRAGKLVRKERLFEEVFSLNDNSSPDAIEVYVHRVRRKLEGSGVVITTLRGLGYVLEARNG
jgi:two-component system, OmpR family, response regulator TctD